MPLPWVRAVCTRRSVKVLTAAILSRSDRAFILSQALSARLSRHSTATPRWPVISRPPTVWTIKFWLSLKSAFGGSGAAKAGNMSPMRERVRFLLTISNAWMRNALASVAATSWYWFGSFCKQAPEQGGLLLLPYMVGENRYARQIFLKITHKGVICYWFVCWR